MKTPDEIKRLLANYNQCIFSAEELAADALAYIRQLEDHIRDLTKMMPTWISVEERLPTEFVSVLAHMTDAGELPAVREAYNVCGWFFFPSLHENHPVDYWAEMPELPKEDPE